MMEEQNRTGWDYVADLMSGRIQNTLRMLFNNQAALQAKIKEIQNIMAEKTANEQALLDAANRINSTAETMKTTIESLSQKVSTLQQQAASATAFQPEDLSEEFQTLNAALSNLASAGATVAEAQPVSGTPNDIPNVQGQPIVAPADVSPLAGESGTTNPMVEGSGPMIDQQAPGVTTPGEPPAPVEGDEGTPNIDSLEGGGQGGQSGQDLWAGDTPTGDESGTTPKEDPVPGPFDQ